MSEFAVPDPTPIPETTALPIAAEAIAERMAQSEPDHLAMTGLLDFDEALAEALAAVEAVEAKHNSDLLELTSEANRPEQSGGGQDEAPHEQAQVQRPEIRGMPTVGSADARSQLTEQVRDLKLKLVEARRNQERDQREIEQLMADLGVTRKRYHKLGTELDELRKRLQRAELDLPEQGARNILNALLNPLDHLYEVMDYLTDHEPVSPQGLEAILMLRTQWQRAFSILQVTPFDAVDQPFDAHLHEFIAQTKSDAPVGHVIRQVGRGYLLGGRLLRSARVVVSAGPNPPQEIEEIMPLEDPDFQNF